MVDNNKCPDMNLNAWGESYFRQLHCDNKLDEYLVDNINEVLNKTVWSFNGKKGYKRKIVMTAIGGSKQNLFDYLFNRLQFDEAELPRTSLFLSLGELT